MFVNGDVYREFHPNYDTLIKNPHTYSENTQPSSIVKGSRQNQFEDSNPINYLTKKGCLTKLEIEEKLKPEVDGLLSRLEKLI